MSGEGRAPRGTTTPAEEAAAARGVATKTAAALWDQLGAHQPGTAAALAVLIRALPDDWPAREFGAGRIETVLAEPPGVEPDETAFPIEVAPVGEDGVVDRCRACSAQDGADCRWHRGYAAGVMALYRPVVETLKAQPRMPDAALLEWLDVAATTVGLGEPVPEPPAPAATAAPAAGERGTCSACGEPAVRYILGCWSHSLRNGCGDGEPVVAEFVPAGGAVRADDADGEGAGRLVAYRSRTAQMLRCLAHVPPPAARATDCEAVTAEDLPGGGICTYQGCGVDVLIPQGGAR